MPFSGPSEIATYASAADETAATFTAAGSASVGDEVFVMVAYEMESGGNSPTLSVSDSAGNTWSSVSPGLVQASASNRASLQIFRSVLAHAITGGSNTFTVTATTTLGNGVFAVAVEAFTGIADSDAEVSASNTATTTSPSSGSSGAPTDPDILYLGAIGIYRVTGKTWTPDAGWSQFATAKVESAAGSQVTLCPLYQRVTGGAARTASGSFNSPSQVTIAIVSGIRVKRDAGDLSTLGVGS